MIETSFMNKSEWGPGPWQDEPDRVEWIDEASGLPCLALRANPHSGNWCGYVAVPPGHPYHGRSYSECTRRPPCDESWCGHAVGSVVSVHGGLTFASECDDDKIHGVCHVPQPGAPADVWWFGFDCAHAFDVAPAMRAWERIHMPDLEERYASYRDSRDHYRDLAYVKSEITELAAQLRAVANNREANR